MLDQVKFSCWLVSPWRLEERCVRLNSGYRLCSLGELLKTPIHPLLIACPVLQVEAADKLKAIRSSWSELLLLKHNEAEVVIGPGVALAADLSPSMYWTARMLGMDVEAQYADHAGSTNATREDV